MDRRRPNIEVLDALGGPVVDGLEIEHAASAVGLAVICVEDVVLSDGHVVDEAVPAPVLRDVRDTEIRDLARACLLDVLRPDRDRA